MKSKEVGIGFVDLLEKYKTSEEIIEKAMEYLDRLYNDMPDNLERNPG